MRNTDALRLATKNLIRTKFRSFLTILGVVIGISAIVLFVSLGVGLQKVTSDQVAGMSSLTTLTITQTPQTSSMQEGPKLTDDSIIKFKNIKGVQKASGSVSLPSNVVSTGTNAGALVYGINLSECNLEISALSIGKKIENEHDAVISAALASSFASNHDEIIGKEIAIKIVKNDDGLDYQIDELPFMVVGIDNNSTSNMVYVSKDRLDASMKFDQYSSVKVQVMARKNIDSVKSEIKGMGYQVTSINDLIDQIDKIFLLVEIILGLIGGIGLLVSSLGIINTMTISFLERTREIGIMKAVGASNKDVKKLFLYESALIGVVGGLLGVGLAALIGWLVNLVINFIIRDSGQHLDIFITPVKFASIMVVVAIIISVSAGIYPTRRAQKLLPIDAIRQ